jgi:cytosine/adenosine deaminase-related metal-dependent hydrolase
MHIHLLETRRQDLYARQRFGRSAVAHLDRIGLLGPLTTLGHMVSADNDDLDIVAGSGACICHNCSSNLRLGSGRARCADFVARGIPTALGIDEAGLNDDRDMLQEMRLVLATQRTDDLDGGGVSAATVFRMATEHGAMTTPFGARIGRLDPGRTADLVLHDASRIAGVYLDSSVPLIDALVQRSRPASVRTVMVAGHVVYEDGRFLRVDREAAERELAEDLARPLTDAEGRQQALARALPPYIRKVYATGPR